MFPYSGYAVAVHRKVVLNYNSINYSLRVTALSLFIRYEWDTNNNFDAVDLDNAHRPLITIDVALHSLA